MKRPSDTIENLRKEKLLSLGKEKLIEIISERDKDIKRLEGIITQTMRANVEFHTELQNFRKESLSAKKIPYNQKWSWVQKIIFCLKENDRPMKSHEIISFLEKLDTALPYFPNKTKSFSANLTKTVGYGRIIQYKLKGIQGYFYLLPEWFDENGKIIKKYLEKINLAG